MDGEANGTQEAQGQEEQQQAQEASAQVDNPAHGENASKPDYEALIAERDEKIAALEAQVADAAKSAEAAEALRGQIEELRRQSADERVDFALQLAGCRNVKAGRAVLDDYGGDVEKLKGAEPWLFAAGASASGKTGLPSAGAATDAGKTMRRWRRIAGLDDDGKGSE